VRGGAGNDRVAGGPGGDRVEGGSGSDLVSGVGGGDLIFGGPGGDTIDGGAGNDFIVSNEAPAVADRVLCGPGFDRVSADARDRVARDCEEVSVAAP
jgi:Ca2+-binding RTX toxin-like protein